MKAMLFLFLSALAAALLVGNTSAFGQEEPTPDPSSEFGQEEPTPDPHQPALPPPPAPDCEPPSPGDCEKCEVELAEVKQKLDGAYKLLAERSSTTAATATTATTDAITDDESMHWGIGAKSGLLPGNRTGITQAYGLVRWIPGPVGVDGILAIGVWPTSDGSVSSAPFAGSLGLAGVFNVADEAKVFIELEYSSMRKPYKDKAGWATAIALLGGADVVVGNFQMRIATGPSIYSSLERLNGWIIGLSVGYYN